MSKKKKRKTKKQKQRAQIHRKEYLERVNKESKISLPAQENKGQETPALTTSDNKEIVENRFTISNIKRSIVYALCFFFIIAILYILELNYHYFSDLSNGLISILTQ